MKQNKVSQIFRLRADIVAMLIKQSKTTNITKTRLVELALVDYLKKGKSFKKYADLTTKSETKSITAKQASLRLKQMRRTADKLRRLIAEVELLSAM
jgi:hypothetical protein